MDEGIHRGCCYDPLPDKGIDGKNIQIRALEARPPEDSTTTTTARRAELHISSWEHQGRPTALLSRSWEHEEANISTAACSSTLKQALRGLRHASRGFRTQSHIINLRKSFWTSVSGLLGGQGRGCLGGGGNRKSNI